MKTQTLNRPFIKQFLPENPVIIEAGAHEGRDTLKMHKMWPRATIYAFEPVPHSYEKLQENVTDITNIKTFNMALSNKTGTAIMHVSPELGAVSSLLKPTILKKEKPTIHFQEIEVKTITLDDWAQQYGIQKVDFLWLDLQGHELAVLKAAPHILKSVKAIYTEAALEERYENQPLYHELKTWLEAQGFYLAAEHFHHDTWGNVLFVRKH